MGRDHSVRSWSRSSTQPAVRAGPRGPAGAVQEHEREQPAGPGVVGEQPAQQPGEPQRLSHPLTLQRLARAGCAVALGKQQVHRREHPRHPFRQLRGRRYAVRDAGHRDLLPGPGQPPRHRRLGHEQQPPDLPGRQPAQPLQRECYLCRAFQRRVAAGEQQPQQVVLDPAVLPLLRRREQRHRRRLLVRPPRLAAQHVEGPPSGGEQQPPPG